MFQKLIKKYLFIIAGCSLYALAFNWCYAPNNIAYGGFTGVAQIVHTLLGFPPVGTLVFCMNVPLFLLGWKLLGGGLLVGSLITMTISSFMIDLVGQLWTFQPMEPILACIYGGVLLGASLGLILSQGSSTGGTDLLARLLKLPFAWLPIGKLLMAVDLAMLLAVSIAFRSMESAMYGIIALYISTTVMDGVLYGLDRSKVAYIVTSEPQAVTEEIDRQLDRGVTYLHGEGSFSREEKLILMCAFKQKQIVPLKELVHELDPQAFLIVCDAHEVQGQGFRRYQKNDI